MTTTTERRIVKQPEAAEYLGVSQSLLEQDRWRRGNIPFFKIGGCVRYDLDSLDRYIDQQLHGNKKGTGSCA